MKSLHLSQHQASLAFGFARYMIPTKTELMWNCVNLTCLNITVNLHNAEGIFLIISGEVYLFFSSSHWIYTITYQGELLDRAVFAASKN